MPPMPYEIGDIVSSKIHPYHHNITAITISGEHLQLPPLMVVIEVLRKRDSTEIDWGDSTVQISYKCLWYSNKSNHFESDWFSAEFLKLIVSGAVQAPSKDGSLVVLKTLYVELEKKKSTLTYDEGQDQRQTSITALLTFLPPVMQIKSIQEYKPKKNEPLGDAAGVKERLVPIREAKCLWYNNNTGKYSEIIIPLEAIQVVEEIPTSVLQGIQDAIKNSKYYKIDNAIVKPQGITSRSGLYFLRAYELVHNATIEISITSESKLAEIEPYRKKAPSFDTDASIVHSNVLKEIIELIAKAIANKSFIRLQYRNRNDRVTIRTLSHYELKELHDGEKKITFLNGYCYLRKEERIFRIERIQNIQDLNESFA